MATKRPPAPLKAIEYWLYVCCALVFAMVLLGGITRLTESGLSIVYWRPFTGWIPPMSDAAWAAVFDSYRDSPEFRKLNFWMSLDDFKRIFWLEYLHRVLGRIIGIVYFLPFLWFLIRYRLPAGLTGRLAILFVLGGLQGALGWYMVKSGLVDQPSVSQYRLAAHLGLAVIIYAAMLYTALGLRTISRPPAYTARGARNLCGLIFVTMIWGALVAGMDGGAVFTTFPLMDGGLLPPHALSISPVWLNLFENIGTVQFIHRVLAVCTVIAALWLWWTHRHEKARPVAWIAVFAGLQFCLGIATILSGASIYIAWAHQGGAMLLFTAANLAWREGATKSRA
jgi:cytochrome c oxidase assembly protein subunit 15